MLKYAVILDDDSINNYVCEKLLNDAFPNLQVKNIIDSDVGHDFIIMNKDQIEFLLLDLNLPKIDGFEFLINLKKIIAINFHIFILTSSINLEDEEKVKSFPEIKGFYKTVLYCHYKKSNNGILQLAKELFTRPKR